MVNFSTERTIGKATCDSEVTAMDNEHTGQLMFRGDAQGSIYSVVVTRTPLLYLGVIGSEVVINASLQSQQYSTERFLY